MSDIFRNIRDDDSRKLSKKGVELYEEKMDKLLEETKTELNIIQTHLNNTNDPDVYRDVLVRLSSLIDFYFSEIMKYIVPSIFKSTIDLPNEWNFFEVPMSKIREIVDDWDKNDYGGKWIEDVYYDNYYENSNQALKNIKKVFNLIQNNCYRDFVKKYESQIQDKLKSENISISQMISNLYQYRNRIVHSYDYKKITSHKEILLIKNI